MSRRGYCQRVDNEKKAKMALKYYSSNAQLLLRRSCPLSLNLRFSTMPLLVSLSQLTVLSGTMTVYGCNIC